MKHTQKDLNQQGTEDETHDYFNVDDTVELVQKLNVLCRFCCR